MGYIFRIGVVFIFAYFFIRFLPGIPVYSVITQKLDQFTVSGEGKVTVVPDTAIVDLGVSSTKPSVKAAQTEANTVISNVTAELKRLEVADVDIKTSSYTIYPQYDYRDGTNRVTGYQVNANLTITVRNIDLVNQVIDSATAKGANNVSGVQLTVDEAKRKELVKQARDIAVKEAKDKAVALAASAGFSLGSVINIQESSPLQAPSYFMEKAVGMGGGGRDTQIQPGSTDITSSVVLTYETR